ncbi:uncharacterized protein NEMAJ01_1579 [Nematocida major]|uniref:uncharacterized protein n=1 Tax=Nematocida major TaxID=1912982 RepID=UPI0020080CD5|nr:uncharacterized protein NEMAJ01_1579 [Nematocida major]KAH9386683.1 hypothetical protein NEMAJ01_1579 [Nematocida major]
MGKTHRREKSIDRSAMKPKEAKNPLIKPVQSIRIGSPSMGSSRDQSRTHIKMGNIRMDGGRPQAEGDITLDNYKTEGELQIAMKKINKAAKKIEEAHAQKKAVATWEASDSDYTLTIDPAMQKIEFEEIPESFSEESEESKQMRIESTQASDWEDFPTEEMPVLRSNVALHTSLGNMRISDANKKAKAPLSGSSAGKAMHPKMHELLTTPAHLRHTGRRFGEAKTARQSAGSGNAPLKKAAFAHADNIRPAVNTPDMAKHIKGSAPTYTSENVLGYSKVDPKTNARATYFNIMQNKQALGEQGKRGNGSGLQRGPEKTGSQMNGSAAGSKVLGGRSAGSSARSAGSSAGFSAGSARNAGSSAGPRTGSSARSAGFSAGSARNAGSSAGPRTGSSARSAGFSAGSAGSAGSRVGSSAGSAGFQTSPADHSAVANANRIRATALAQEARVVMTENGLAQVQRMQRREVVERVYKTKNPSKHDPSLKRVNHKVHNRVAMNEYAKATKYPSTYKPPKMSDLE